MLNKKTIVFRYESLGNTYKLCYGKTLHQGTLPFSDLVKHIAEVLLQLEKILEKVDNH